MGHSANAVRWQVWTALLLYVLMRFQAFWHATSPGWHRRLRDSTRREPSKTPSQTMKIT
jgi:hypothetical protein